MRKFYVSIEASTGSALFYTDGPEELRGIVAMVASGAQVNRSMAVRITDQHKRATVVVEARSARNMCDAVDHALAALHVAQPRPYAENENRDVSVRVHMAVDGSVSLEQARGFVEAAMERALDEHAKAEGVSMPLYQYNGAPAHDARWED